MHREPDSIRTVEGIGAALPRKEDARFLCGRGRYVCDIALPGMTWAVLVRSPHPHARVLGVETAAARAGRGVLGVFTAADLRANGVSGLPCAWPVTGKDGAPTREPEHYPLADGVVRHVGDPVALVIAETEELARDAAEQVIVEYEPLPAVTATDCALAPGAPRVYSQYPDNLCVDWEVGSRSATDAAFVRASAVASLRLVNNRLVGNPMEPRAAIGDFDAGSTRYTLYTTSQFPHIVKLLMGSAVLHVGQNDLRVVSPDVGGGFGVKQFHYAEEALVTWAAGRLRRPVKWVCQRSEAFLSDAHGRDHVTEAELALDGEGHFLGLRVRTTANLGAYLSTFGPNIPTNLYGLLLAGVYRTPAVHCEVKCVFTHTNPVDAYRGAGRPEATYVLERLVDVAAARTGLDPVEIRRRNLIPAAAFPYDTPVGLQYDSGDPEACLDRVLAVADWAGFPARRAASVRRGRLRGIGLVTYIEACGLAPSKHAVRLGARGGLFESATVRVQPTGEVTVLIGTHNHGQGHETTCAQIVAHRLGIAPSRVKLVCGDTDKVQFGLGTYGSRSAAVGGSALFRALDKIVAKGRRIAAHQLEVDDTDIVFDDGRFAVAGTDLSRTFEQIAASAHTPVDYPLDTLEPGLEAQAFYDPVNFTYPSGAHVAEVEIDPDTGVVAVVRYTAVDDVGTVINPMIVEGQLHGGIAQGLGQALLEACVYDETSGQLLTGSFGDYCLPRASHVPDMTIETHAVPCTHNPLGVKGAGEVGTIAAPATIINAVVDALAPCGVTHVDMPATPQKVWRLIEDALRSGRWPGFDAGVPAS